jgi:hypothetical protein
MPLVKTTALAYIGKRQIGNRFKNTDYGPSLVAYLVDVICSELKKDEASSVCCAFGFTHRIRDLESAERMAGGRREWRLSKKKFAKSGSRRLVRFLKNIRSCAFKFRARRTPRIWSHSSLEHGGLLG